MSASLPQMPQLVELAGPHTGRVHALPYGSHVVGRGVPASVRLDHPDVSRRHARLEVDAEGVVVRDLGSKNGVWIGGRRVEEPVRLGHDDQFSLGELSLRVLHPAVLVTRALAAGGETTATADSPPPSEPRLELRAVLVPLVGVLVFGTLVLVMLLR